MRQLTWMAAAVAAIPLCQLSAQTESGPADTTPAPLFASETPIELVLNAPFNSLFRNRNDDAPPQPATIVYVDGGDSTVMELEVELRGKNRRRRQVCNFPPLRLDFPRSEMDGTIFENQNRIKVVTHCQNGRERYEQYVLLEYVLYRVLNLFTDLSFNVRLVNFTYIDTEGKDDTLSRVGFLIEDDDRMAERNGWEILEIPAIFPSDLDPAQLNLIEVFQYFIGHTDWSAFKAGEGDDRCCHNGRLVGSPAGPVYPVPYDFDFAGVINARYAEVAEAIGTRSVRQRVYRGICHAEGVLEATLQRFIDRKDEIYALFQNQPGLEERQIEDAIKYLDDFYETATDSRRVERNLGDRCRSM